MENGSKWAPVTTDWRAEKYEAVGANGAKVVILKGTQYDRIAKAGGKNPLARLIDSFQVYYEMQKRIQALQDQVAELTLQVEDANKKARKSWNDELEARRDMVFLQSRLDDREKKLKELEQLGAINCFNDILIAPVRDENNNILYYKKLK